MGSHRPPALVRPSRLWLGLMAAAVTGIVGGTVAAGHATAPRVAADVRLSLTPERSPEPVAHGGIGGPLVLPSIGAVVSDPPAYLPPVPVVHTSRPVQRPQEPRRTVRGSTGARPTVPGAPSPTTAVASVPPVTTEARSVEDPTPSVGDVGAGTTPATTSATTTTEATTTSASATTTSETADVTVTVTASSTPEVEP